MASVSGLGLCAVSLLAAARRATPAPTPVDRAEEENPDPTLATELPEVLSDGSVFVQMLKAASAWEDSVYNMTRRVKTVALQVNDAVRRRMPRTLAMATGLKMICGQ